MPSSPASEPASEPTPRAEDAGRRSGAPSRPERAERPSARTEDRYKRALADLDNYRKRSAREIERRVAESREGCCATGSRWSTASSGRC